MKDERVGRGKGCTAGVLTREGSRATPTAVHERKKVFLGEGRSAELDGGSYASQGDFGWRRGGVGNTEAADGGGAEGAMACPRRVFLRDGRIAEFEAGVPPTKGLAWALGSAVDLQQGCWRRGTWGFAERVRQLTLFVPAVSRQVDKNLYKSNMDGWSKIIKMEGGYKGL